ncbi:hypothetical protein BDW74DRAFT_177568 [Aspergillus multicolor]|uniref:proteasome regulatory particle lid subunit SEM1 n=1 Tax=Aspergillus multicolor TaxID=41759 RepID=UPI003CCE13A6
MSNTQSQDTKQQEASQQPQQQKPTVLEEDDEFEDFPVDGESSARASGTDLSFSFLKIISPPQASIAMYRADTSYKNKMLTYLLATDWPENETEQATANGNNVHLWEESWDDDDAAEDFSKQLKEELKKVDASSS